MKNIMPCIIGYEEKDIIQKEKKENKEHLSLTV